MPERAVISGKGSLPDEQLSLSDTSLSEDARFLVERNVHLLLEDMRLMWSEATSRFEQNQDAVGKDLSEKVPILCTALLRLVRPVILTATQQCAVREMIICEASDSNLNRILHPGDSARAVLAIATYINTAGR